MNQPSWCQLYASATEVARQLFTTTWAACCWSGVGVLAFALGVVGHEGLQHAGAACLLIGLCVALTAVRRARQHRGHRGRGSARETRATNQGWRAICALAIALLPFGFWVFLLSAGEALYVLVIPFALLAWASWNLAWRWVAVAVLPLGLLAFAHDPFVILALLPFAALTWAIWRPADNPN